MAPVIIPLVPKTLRSDLMLRPRFIRSELPATMAPMTTTPLRPRTASDSMPVATTQKKQ
jgi:hypothetical protein